VGPSPPAPTPRPWPAVARGPFCDCGGAATGAVLACPRRDDPDVDCVPRLDDDPSLPLVSDPTSDQPFLRYAGHIAAWRRSPGGYAQTVDALDDAVADLTGRPVTVTPTVQAPGLAAALGRPGIRLLVKDETGLPAGSHKIRHLFGMGLHLRLAGPASTEGERPRLAISSCGNAAYAAAVVAAAMEWPLDVFVPVDVDPAVLSELERFGARVVPCSRTAGQAGDPCHHAFRTAVAAGAVPFGVQGPDNAWCLDGGRTIGFELAEAAGAVGALDHVVVQVGGGALASATYAGLALATQIGVLPRHPVLTAVQTVGAAPLSRAGALVAARAERQGLGAALAWAVRHRSQVMWPWEREPRSVAGGIIDDVTYDWAAVTDAVLSGGGSFPLVDDVELEASNRLVGERLGVAADETGSAGLAGLVSTLDAVSDGSVVAVLLTGVRRSPAHPSRGGGAGHDEAAVDRSGAEVAVQLRVGVPGPQ